MIRLSWDCQFCGSATEGRWSTVYGGNHDGCFSMAWWCNCTPSAPVRLEPHICANRTKGDIN